MRISLGTLLQTQQMDQGQPEERSPSFLPDSRPHRIHGTAVCATHQDPGTALLERSINGAYI